MQIIENAFPKKIFSSIKTQIFSVDFPWSYVPFTGYEPHYNGVSNLRNFHFNHICSAQNEKKISSSIYSDINIGFHYALRKLNIVNVEILRVRVNLFVNVGDHIVHDPHIDRKEPHQFGVLYLDNSDDASTYVYDQKYDPNSELDVFEYKDKILKNKFTICKKIPPKENLLFVCDGLHYHASSTPMQAKERIAINFNFKILD